MKSWIKIGVLVTPCAFILFCATVTIQPERMSKVSSQPSYQVSKPYFFWGLVGEHSIDVKDVCGERKVIQMQSQVTFTDGFLTVITLGIYAPKTAKVWCE